MSGRSRLLDQEELFEAAAEYDEMLHSGLRLAGEDKHYFIEGRIRDLVDQLGPDEVPCRILDFGCGTGDSSARLAREFPTAQVVGLDAASGPLEMARRQFSSERLQFLPARELSELSGFDLCYVNGVFHHIPPRDRVAVVQNIHRALRPGGRFAMFENNPWNPGTHLVMRRIPFDRDAQMLTPSQARKLVRDGGFGSSGITRYLFFFPASLSWLRFAERKLARLPLGAQYYLLVRKRRHAT